MSSAAKPNDDFQNFLEEMKTDALNFFQNTKMQVEHVFMESVKEVTPIISAEAVVVMGQLKTLALNTVAMLAQSEFANLTGSQKQTISIGTVVQGAIAMGKQLAIGDAAQLIQAGYNGLAQAKAGQ